MKKLLSIVLALLMLFTLAACKPADSSKDKSDNNELVDENLLTVDVTIPASFFSEDSPASAELTEEQKADGFKSAVVNADGSVTYTIKKSSWNKLLDEMKVGVSRGLEDIATGGDYASIRDIEYNDDFSKVSLIVDRSEYEASLDSFACFGIYMGVAYYQLFSGADEPKCEISIEDESTGEKFDSIVYPDALEQQ